MSDITNYVDFITKHVSYFKIRSLLQNASVHVALYQNSIFLSYFIYLFLIKFRRQLVYPQLLDSYSRIRLMNLTSLKIKALTLYNAWW